MKLEDERARCLYFTLMPGIGPKTQNRIIALCGGIEKCFEAEAGDMIKADLELPKWQRIGRSGIEKFVLNRDSQEIWNKTEEINKSCLEKGISFVTVCDEEYPERFRNMEDMPIVLFVKGNLRINEFEHTAGVIGARRCTQDGKNAAIRLVEDNIDSRTAIISGMAKGIDSYANTAAVKKSRYTIAVLGCGPDICYPIENQPLYDAIVQKGCILSEYAPGTQPRRYMFPRRNRLIAALSDRIYVIDAGRKSGTETTVDKGMEYGREIVVVHGMDDI